MNLLFFYLLGPEHRQCEGPIAFRLIIQANKSRFWRLAQIPKLSKLRRRFPKTQQFRLVSPSFRKFGTHMYPDQTKKRAWVQFD